MHQTSYLPIYNSSFLLLKDLYQRVPKFGKMYKYTLGEKMLECGMDMIGCITKANKEKDSKGRVDAITSLLEKTDEMMVYIRIAEELRQFNSDSAYLFLSEKIADISRQGAGWKNTYLPQNS